MKLRSLILIGLFALLFVSLVSHVPQVNATPILIDSYTEANSDSNMVLNAIHPSPTDQSSIGQCFDSDGLRYNVTSCKFYVGKAGNPVGNLRVGLYEISGTYGVDGLPNGSILADSDDVAIAPLGAQALVTFTFSIPYTLNASKKYCLEIYVHDATVIGGADKLNVGRDVSVPTHDGNYFHYVAGAYTAIAARDTCFYVYGELIAYSVTFYYNSGGQLEVDGSLIANGTENAYGMGVKVPLKAYPDGSMLFVNYTWNSNYNMSNPYNLTVSDDYTVWCYFTTSEVEISPIVYAAIALAVGAVGLAAVDERRKRR